MSAATDILLGSNGDLPIEQNNFTIGFSDNQHIEDCLVSFPGQWKQFLQTGVGMLAYQRARVNPLACLNKIKQQLQNDGYRLKNPQVTLGTDGLLKVDLTGTTRP